MKYLIYFILLWLSISCSSEGLKTSMPEAETLKYRTCTTDSDCIYINNGCCDCANGGEELSININQQEEFQDEFDCNDVSCTEIATQQCPDLEVQCVNTICEIVQ